MDLIFSEGLYFGFHLNEAKILSLPYGDFTKSDIKRGNISFTICYLFFVFSDSALEILISAEYYAFDFVFCL